MARSGQDRELIWIANFRLVAVEDAKRRETRTDADGRFRLDGLAPERIVEMSLTGATIAYTTDHGRLLARWRRSRRRALQTSTAPDRRSSTARISPKQRRPAIPSKGVVKDAKTGKPLADVEVRISSFAGSPYGNVKAPRTTTDAQGRFRLDGVPKRKGTILLVVPNEHQPYFIQFAVVPNPDGPEPIKIEAGLHKGIWIEGKSRRATDR